MVRKVLSAALAGERDIEVVGTATDAYAARDKILTLNPDVLTLDIEMPRMDGITFLRKLMHFRPIPVVVISSLGAAACQASVEALRAGAVEVLCKPNGPQSVGALGNSLAETIRSAAVAKVHANRNYSASEKGSQEARKSNPALALPALRTFSSNSVLAIGASTGGPAAVMEVLAGMPRNCPPIILVQHMPAVFTKHFAERLNNDCEIEVKEAEDGDMLLPGRALIAPGDYHMTLRSTPSGYGVRISQGPPVCFSRPSVDVLFSSVADVARGKSVAVVLTGMGSDGARGMLEMRQQGAMTIAQNEDTCVVYGMPKEAVRIGAAQSVLPLKQIASAALEPFQMAKAS